MMFVVFSNLVFVVLIFPLKAMLKGNPLVNILPLIGLLLQAIYLSWCYNGFFQLSTAGGRFKSLLVSLFCNCIVVYVLPHHHGHLYLSKLGFLSILWEDVLGML